MLQWNMVSPENLAFQFVGSREETVGYIQRHIREGVAAYCHTPTDAQTNQITSKQALTSGPFEYAHLCGACDWYTKGLGYLLSTLSKPWLACWMRFQSDRFYLPPST